jgi:CRISPR-associated endoribonuclease Cas6
MNIHVNLIPESGSLILPINYNHMLQSAIYSSIGPEIAQFLHDKGYVVGNRIFKLFCFSRLEGKYSIDFTTKTITFLNKIKLIISSPIDNFCESLINTMLTKGQIELYKTKLNIESICVSKNVVQNEMIRCQVLSPITVYSTLFRPDGRKYTCYFQPGDPDYNLLIEMNLRKKYLIVNGVEAPEGEVSVKRLGRGRMEIVQYKDTIIKGYMGNILLRGPSALLQLALDAGIGSKNSQGFGCIIMLNNQR